MEALVRGVESGGGCGLSSRFGYAMAGNIMLHGLEDHYCAKFVSGKGCSSSSYAEIGLFGVFDGHKGSEVAEFLQQCLFDSILENVHFATDPKRAIREAYLLLDSRIIAMGRASKNWRSGSTATTCLLLDGHRLIVANVGDSRAVLSRAGEAVTVSVDHEPQKPEEREMVESKGGVVSRTFGGVYRVDRRLAMSRAFGDYDLKEHLSVEPDIWEGELTPEDEFLIVASDGLWHKISSQKAVDAVRELEDAKLAAETLVSAALQKKETDDITVIVVTFPASSFLLV